MMLGRGTRRDFLSQAGALAAATAKSPHDFVIVEGHRDMWELSARTRLPGADNHTPIDSHLVPRLIDAGITVCIADREQCAGTLERRHDAGVHGPTLRSVPVYCS